MAYNDKYLYAAFDFGDPNPKGIRAPIGDHYAVSGTTDYGGLIIDSHNDGKTAQLFLANPNGVQYDAITSDASGEDNAPDFYWDAAGKITATGWTMEIRVPFSSLRYSDAGDRPRVRQKLLKSWLSIRHPFATQMNSGSRRLPRRVSCLSGVPHR